MDTTSMLQSSIGTTTGSRSGPEGGEWLVVMTEAQLQGMVKEVVCNEIAKDRMYTKDKQT